MCSNAPYTINGCPSRVMDACVWVKQKGFPICLSLATCSSLLHTYTHRLYTIFVPGVLSVSLEVWKGLVCWLCVHSLSHPFLDQHCSAQSRVNATAPIIHLVFVFATWVLRQSLYGPRLISGLERWYHTRTQTPMFIIFLRFYFPAHTDLFHLTRSSSSHPLQDILHTR